MIIELMKGFTCIRHDVRMSGMADREGSWVERREGTWGALPWR
jgi:hypothetical protein